ncbi:unnamed protein product, partial [Chrysoparadoxa australica]
MRAATLCCLVLAATLWESDGFVGFTPPVRTYNGRVLRMSATESSGVSSIQRSMDDYGDEEALLQVPEVKEQASGQSFGKLVDPQDRLNSMQRRAEPGSMRGAFFVNAAVAGVLGGGLILSGRAYYNRQEGLVESYADEMMYALDGVEEVKSCHKEFKRRLGPKQFRQEMFVELIRRSAQKKPLSAPSMEGLATAVALFKFRPVKVAKLICLASKDLPKRGASGVRSKLLFYGERFCAGNDKAMEALEPVRASLAAAYRSGGMAIVTQSQQSMGEQALRDTLSSPSFNDELPQGYEGLLGLTTERASEIVEEVAKSGRQKQTTWQAWYGGEGRDDSPSETDDPEAVGLYQQLAAKDGEGGGEGEGATGGGNDSSPTKAHECSKCGECSAPVKSTQANSCLLPLPTMIWSTSLPDPSLPFFMHLFFNWPEKHIAIASRSSFQRHASAQVITLITFLPPPPPCRLHLVFLTILFSHALQFYGDDFKC